MEYLIIATIGFIAFFLKGMTGTGTTTAIVALYGISMTPSMVLGIYFGNLVFQKISEKTFKRILAVFLLAIALKLFFG